MFFNIYMLIYSIINLYYILLYSLKLISQSIFLNPCFNILARLQKKIKIVTAINFSNLLNLICFPFKRNYNFLHDVNFLTNKKARSLHACLQFV